MTWAKFRFEDRRVNLQSVLIRSGPAGIYSCLLSAKFRREENQRDYEPYRSDSDTNELQPAEFSSASTGCVV